MSHATITITCWGCNKSETHPLVHGEEYERHQQDLAERGWRRRGFGPSSWDKGPWFCSGECAHESYNAKQAEAYWENKDEEDRQREFQRYCRETQIPKVFFAVFGVIIALLASLLMRGFIQ